jgi:glycosyltransferase involved in cell wall biosynthesis
VLVSVLIITWKRAALLQKCLASLAPWARETALQVHVVLNGDDAETRAVLTGLDYDWLEWSEIPVTTPGAARNAGLVKLRGEWCFLIDDDARVPAGYLEHWRATLAARPDADVIGGPDGPDPDDGPLAKALALTLASPLCSGPTVHRHRPAAGEGRTADETILTSCNLWVRTVKLREHPFPESHRRGEETALLQKLARAGARQWYTPALRVWHARRDRWGAIARTSFWSGHWRARNGGGVWFVLPAVFVALHSLLLTAVGVWLVVAWALLVLPRAARDCVRVGSCALWPRVCLLHWLVPFTYGMGWLHGQIQRSTAWPR